MKVCSPSKDTAVESARTALMELQRLKVKMSDCDEGAPTNSRRYWQHLEMRHLIIVIIIISQLSLVLRGNHFSDVSSTSSLYARGGKQS